MSETAVVQETAEAPVKKKRGPGRPPKRESEEPKPRSPEPASTGKAAYWCGVLPSSPKQNVSVAGFTFHRFTERVEDVEGSVRQRRTRQCGSLMQLSQQDVRDIRRAARRLVIRMRGANEHARPYTVSDDRYDVFVHNMTRKPDHLPDVFPRYRHQAKDQVIGQHLWMVPVSEVVKELGPTWASADEATIAQSIPRMLADSGIPKDEVVMEWAEDKARALGYGKKVDRRKADQ